MSKDVVFVKLDVDKFPTIASKYQVTGIPSVILFDSGELIWKRVGLQQKESLKAGLNAHMKEK
jgi:thioredoxin 1